MWKWIVTGALIIILVVLLNPPYRMVQSGDKAYLYNVYTGRVWFVRIYDVSPTYKYDEPLSNRRETASEKEARIEANWEKLKNLPPKKPE